MRFGAFAIALTALGGASAGLASCADDRIPNPLTVPGPLSPGSPYTPPVDGGEPPTDGGVDADAAAPDAGPEFIADLVGNVCCAPDAGTSCCVADPGGGWALSPDRRHHCSAYGCLAAGGFFYTGKDVSPEECLICCAGLTPHYGCFEVPAGDPFVDYNIATCIACGDGVCGAGESSCNCPADCPTDAGSDAR